MPPDDDRATVLGLDNVRLELPLAGLGSRTLAVIIDYHLLYVVALVVAALILVGGTLAGLDGGWIVALVVLSFFLVQWGYFWVLEIVMDGRTPGKSALGIQVVGRHGGRASRAAILIRNLVRAIDVFVGPVVMALDGRYRRLGDVLAGTVVVHRRRDAAKVESESRVEAAPEEWEARETAVLEAFLRRRETMDEAAGERLAGRLLDWILARHPEVMPDGDPRPRFPDRDAATLLAWVLRRRRREAGAS